MSSGNLLHKRLVDRFADQEQQTETRKITEETKTNENKLLPKEMARLEIKFVVLDVRP